MVDLADISEPLVFSSGAKRSTNLIFNQLILDVDEIIFPVETK